MDKEESPIAAAAAAAARDDNNTKNEFHNLKRKDEESGRNPNENKVRSCKGYLYYSSALKSISGDPICDGVSRSVPYVTLEKSVVEAMAREEELKYPVFEYKCYGQSFYSDEKGQKDEHDKKTKLPACSGTRYFLQRKATAADLVPADAHNREDNHNSPAVSVGDELLQRFTSSAGQVATRVAENVRRVGNQLKASLDDILDPNSRRPK